MPSESKLHIVICRQKPTNTFKYLQDTYAIPAHTSSFLKGPAPQPIVPTPSSHLSQNNPPTQFSCQALCTDLSCHRYKLGPDAPDMSNQGTTPVLGLFCQIVLHVLKKDIYFWIHQASNIIFWLIHVFCSVLTRALHPSGSSRQAQTWPAGPPSSHVQDTYACAENKVIFLVFWCTKNGIPNVGIKQVCVCICRYMHVSACIACIACIANMCMYVQVCASMCQDLYARNSQSTRPQVNVSYFFAGWSV
jgi:hypothetical protein